MYKKASQLQLRFNTTKGQLTVEQLWDLPLTMLDALAVSLETEYKKSGKKSFLVTKSRKDKELKLAFDIVLDVLTTKMEEAAAAKNIADTKEHNQRILELIKRKQDSELEDKSIKELEKLLK
jgi:hypothetical protein